MRIDKAYYIENKMYFVRAACAFVVVILFILTCCKGITVNAAEYKYDKDGNWLLTDIVRKSGYDLDHSKKYEYTHLTKPQKELYDRLKRCVLNFGVMVECPSGIEELDLVVVDYAFHLSEPELFWYFDSVMDGDSIFIEYSIDKKTEIDKINKKINKQASAVLSKVKSLNSDYEKAKYIHDWIIKRNTYTIKEDPKDNHLYNALCGTKPCGDRAYSTAFQYLCDLANIDCVSLGGYCTFWGSVPENGYAFYNKVKISGDWYNILVGHDDDAGNETGIKDYISYSYFCVPDSWITDHISNPGAYIFSNENGDFVYELVSLPKATKSTYNYYVRNRLNFSSRSQVRSSLKSQIQKIFDGKKNQGIVQLRCANTNLYKNYNDMDNEVKDIVSEIKKNSKYNIDECNYALYYGEKHGSVIVAFSSIMYSNRRLLAIKFLKFQNYKHWAFPD